MADREYIRVSKKEAFPGLTENGYRCLVQMAQKLNELLTMKNDLASYADNAAAVSAGLATGDWYYDTTLGGVRIVT